ncbi:MAG: ArsR/SmtB family transcription factor [Erysipelotrichaceae bacterium]
MEQAKIMHLLQQFQQSQPILLALGDAVRQHIIIRMLEASSEQSRCNGMRVNEIAAYSNLSRPAISHHLQILKQAGILKMRKEGTKNYYYFDTEQERLDGLIHLLILTKDLMKELPDCSGEHD